MSTAPHRYTNADLETMSTDALRAHLREFCQADTRRGYFDYADGVAHLIARRLLDETAAAVLNEACAAEEH